MRVVKPVRHAIRWLALGTLVGTLAGVASAVFLIALDWATQTRIDNSQLIFALPLAGFMLGWMYHHYAGVAAQGNNLLIQQIQQNDAPIPRRMAPFILLATVWTHLFGGSAGREGAAVQMGGSLADAVRRLFKLEGEDRRALLLAGMSGGFGGVFGTPLAGFIFALEVQRFGSLRYDGLIACLTGAIVADLVARALGIQHTHYPALPIQSIQPVWMILALLTGVASGLTAQLYIRLHHWIKTQAAQRIPYPPLRPFIGGCLIILLTLIVGNQDYLGLSLPLINRSLNGEGVVLVAFALKLLCTAITLGMGFVGGEVTPLFVMGSTLGYALGSVLGVEPSMLAALGFVGVFAGASNTPLACTLMGIELFGGGGAVYLAVACFTAYLLSGARSIYPAQQTGTPKW
jgi:H+/Cl- antiporter ClcA